MAEAVALEAMKTDLAVSITNTALDAAKKQGSRLLRSIPAAV